MASRAWTSDRVASALWTIALGLALFTTLLLVWPATPRVPTLARVASPRPAPPRAGRPIGDVTVRNDLFAVGHVPPRARWAPPPIDTLPPGLAPDPTAAGSLDASAPIDPPRFYGTVVDARGAAALLRFPGSDESRLYHAGNGARGWRVIAVAPERVTVADPNGARHTLRLRPDTTPVP